MSKHNDCQDKPQQGRTILIGIMLICLFLYGCDSKPNVYRVGILYGIDAHGRIADGFKAKMTEIGYIEAQNIVYDVQKTNNDRAKDRQLSKKFVTDKVDLIFAFPTQQALAAKAATQGTDIPVVFAFSTIEETRLVESVRNPGKNITGIRYPLPELTAKRFELLCEIAPHIKRLWISYDINYPTTKLALKALRPAASSKGVTLIEVPGAKVEAIPADLEARSTSSNIGLDAILIMPEPNPQSPVGWSAIRKFAAAHRVPINGLTSSQTEQGALFSYNPDLVEMGRLAAPMVNKILKGTPAGSLPVITPVCSLWINYNVARKLGLKVSEGLLSQASKIIR